MGGLQGGPGGASYLVLAKTHHLWQRQTDAKKKKNGIIYLLSETFIEC